jgi:tetratricopeptide (TPR) repeat protein
MPNVLVGFAVTLAIFFAVTVLPVRSQTWGSTGPQPDARKGQSMRWLQQGMRLHQGGDLSGAIECYKKALSTDPRNKWTHYYMGLAYEQTGNLQGAHMQLKTCLNNDYNFIEARNELGIVFRKMDDIEGAQREFTECIKINPRYPFPYYHLGTILQQKGDLPHAIDAYETACRLKPDFWEAQRDLGLAIFERAKTGEGSSMSEALEKLQIAAKLVPDNPMIQYHIGEIYANDGKLDEAEAAFRKTLMLDPRHAAAHWELARLRYYRGDLDRCLTETREALKIQPTYTESRKYPKVDPVVMKITIAACLETKGKLIDAVEAWKEVAQMVQRNEFALVKINELETFLRKEAKKKKKKPLTYDPEEIDALVAKGIGQYEDGDLEGAKASFQRAIELNPQSFEALQNLGAVQEAQGDLNSAMATFQKALAVKPTFDGAYYNLAYLLEKLNLPADAGLMYQKFHEVAPTHKYPYDPKHIVALQQEDARRRAKEEERKRRGY